VFAPIAINSGLAVVAGFAQYFAMRSIGAHLWMEDASTGEGDYRD
jgi:hypothetical protein